MGEWMDGLRRRVQKEVEGGGVRLGNMRLYGV